MARGMNGSDIKRKNRGLILKNIALNHANSRVALSQVTGLTKMTAGNIVQELLEQGLIETGDAVPVEATGPNPTLLSIADTAPKIIGIYLSRDMLVISVGDLSGRVMSSDKVLFAEESTASILEKLVAGVQRAAAKVRERILAIGVAMIGPIDGTGAIVGTPNFFGIERLPVREVLQQKFPYPVVVYNDISAAAVAEQMIGGNPFSNFVYIGMANGLGAGMIHNNELMTANQSFIGEFGHTTIDYNGTRCPCGNTGCLELYVSATVLCRRFSELLGRDVRVEEFAQLADLPECDAIFKEVSHKLATGMINLANLLGPEAFVLGHLAYHFPDRYVTLMEQTVNRVKFLGHHEKIQVLKSCFGDQAAVYGSICCVLREVFSGRILFE